MVNDISYCSCIVSDPFSYLFTEQESCLSEQLLNSKLENPKLNKTQSMYRHAVARTNQSLQSFTETQCNEYSNLQLGRKQQNKIELAENGKIAPFFAVFHKNPLYYSLYFEFESHQFVFLTNAFCKLSVNLRDQKEQLKQSQLNFVEPSFDFVFQD